MGKEAQKSQFFLFLWLKIFTYFITNIIIFNYNNFALKHIFTHNCQILHKIPENEKDTNIYIYMFEIFLKKKCITLRKFFFFFHFFCHKGINTIYFYYYVYITSLYFRYNYIYFIFLKVSCFFLPTFHLYHPLHISGSTFFLLSLHIFKFICLSLFALQLYFCF